MLGGLWGTPDASRTQLARKNEPPHPSLVEPRREGNESRMALVNWSGRRGVVVTITEQRAKQVEAAIHSAEIEGLTVTSATRADADSYVAGTIDSAELLDRVRSRYGLT
ncbi:hypothetical protein [Microbacterium invictum]|uniref:antitoxin VbhA family protein n=2 Tax=Microbacterium invictum TaxID=515415 RepID=UPI0030CA29E4